MKLPDGLYLLSLKNRNTGQEAKVGTTEFELACKELEWPTADVVFLNAEKVNGIVVYKQGQSSGVYSPQHSAKGNL